jgi:acetoin utilization protein AcuA
MAAVLWITGGDLMIFTCCDVDIPGTATKEFTLEGPVSPETLEILNINNKLTNFRPAKEQKKSLISISEMPESMIYIARAGCEIVGYVTFHAPDKYFRWSKHPKVLELGGIEISCEWRKRGIAEELLKEAFSNPVMEDYIVITTEFCWSWDLRGSGLDVFEYQKMLEKLFGIVGLKRKATNDPDITEHPANVLMARIGKSISSDDILMFEKLLFEETPEFH